jgi:hypothetical protein
MRRLATSFYKIRQTAEWGDIKEADPRVHDGKNRASSRDVLRKLTFAKEGKAPPCDVTRTATVSQVNTCLAHCHFCQLPGISLAKNRVQ